MFLQVKQGKRHKFNISVEFTSFKMDKFKDF